jgi:choline dehydrogenase-like flavoprotein
VITILKIIKGHGNDWPIRYKDLTKWYDYVEQFAGISGQAENWPLLLMVNFTTYGFKLCGKIS